MAYSANGDVIIGNDANIRNVGVATIGLVDAPLTKTAITAQTEAFSSDVSGSDELLLFDNETSELRRITVQNFLQGSGLQPQNSLTDGPISGIRNKLLNGNFNIWSLWDGHDSIDIEALPGTTDAGAVRLADSWRLYNHTAIGGVGFARQVLTSAESAEIGSSAQYALNIDFDSSGAAAAVDGYGFVDTFIENAIQFVNEEMTLSFWAKSPGNIKLGFEFSRVFGHKGLTPAASPPEFSNRRSFDLTPTWTKYSYTFTCPDLSGAYELDFENHIVLRFYFYNGSGEATRASNIGLQAGNFSITNVQFERGAVSTPYEEVDYATQYNMNQRYCIDTYILATNPPRPASRLRGISLDADIVSFNIQCAATPRKLTSYYTTGLGLSYQSLRGNVANSPLLTNATGGSINIDAVTILLSSTSQSMAVVHGIFGFQGGSANMTPFALHSSPIVFFMDLGYLRLVDDQLTVPVISVG